MVMNKDFMKPGVDPRFSFGMHGCSALEGHPQEIYKH